MRELKRAVLILLIATLYVKFVVQIVLDESNLLLDLLLYMLLIAGLVDRKFRPEFFVVVLFAVISVLNPAARNIFLIFASVYALREFSIRELASINLCMQTLVFGATALMLWAGITHSEMFEQSLLDQRERWDFGYGNPNTFALFVYSIMVNAYVYFARQYGRMLSLLLFLTGIGVYCYTKSRTFLVATLVLLLVHWCVRNRVVRSVSLKFKGILYLIPIVLMGCILYMSRYSGQFPLLNLVFSGRLELYSVFLGSIGKTAYLFGTPLVNEETIDSSYLHILFEGGVLAFVIFYVLYVVTVRRMNRSTIGVLPVLAGFLVFGLSESLFTFVLIFGNMIIWSILYDSYLNRSHP